MDLVVQMGQGRFPGPFGSGAGWAWAWLRGQCSISFIGALSGIPMQEDTDGRGGHGRFHEVSLDLSPPREKRQAPSPPPWLP